MLLSQQWKGTEMFVASVMSWILAVNSSRRSEVPWIPAFLA